MSVRSIPNREGEAPAEPELDRSELPEGWAVTKLQDVGKWCSGGTPSRTKPEYFGQGIPWVKSGDLTDGPIVMTDEHITRIGLDNSAAKLMPLGTICMALYGATIGKLGTMTFEASTNQATANLVPDERLVDGQYVFHYLLSKQWGPLQKPRKYISFASKFAHFFLSGDRFPILDSYAVQMVRHHLGWRNCVKDQRGDYLAFVANMSGVN